MKRIIAILLIIISVFSLTSCTRLLPINLFSLGKEEKLPQTDSTPVDTPEPQPESQPEQKPESYKQIDITSDIQQRVNIFLSNFSEQSFSEAEPFDVKTADVGKLIDYAHLYNRINRSDEYWDNFEMSEDGFFANVTVSQTITDIQRFFGIKLTRQDIETAVSAKDRCDIVGDKIRFESGIGATYPYFTVAHTMKELGDGTYLAEFNVYEITDYNGDGEILTVGGGITKKSLYSMTLSQADSKEYLKKTGTGTAIIRPYNSKGYETYQLISYNIAA